HKLICTPALPRLVNIRSSFNARHCLRNTDNRVYDLQHEEHTESHQSNSRAILLRPFLNNIYTMRQQQQQTELADKLWYLVDNVTS
ncbi:hypothetical protein H9Q72_014518, partial [Fusarium xylarioides]